MRAYWGERRLSARTKLHRIFRLIDLYNRSHGVIPPDGSLSGCCRRSRIQICRLLRDVWELAWGQLRSGDVAGRGVVADFPAVAALPPAPCRRRGPGDRTVVPGMPLPGRDGTLFVRTESGQASRTPSGSTSPVESRSTPQTRSTFSLFLRGTPGVHAREESHPSRPGPRSGPVVSPYPLASLQGTNRISGDTAQIALTGRMSLGLSWRGALSTVPHRRSAVDVTSTRQPAVGKEHESVWPTESTSSVRSRPRS